MIRCPNTRGSRRCTERLLHRRPHAFGNPEFDLFYTVSRRTPFEVVADLLVRIPLVRWLAGA